MCMQINMRVGTRDMGCQNAWADAITTWPFRAASYNAEEWMDNTPCTDIIEHYKVL